MLDRLRGPASLVALSASFALGRPSATLPALRLAFEVGRRVRRAPVLRSDPTRLVRADELVEICSLVSDTHVTVEGRAPVEFALDPGQWPWRAAPTSDDLARGLTRVLADIAARSARTVIWCGDEVDTGSTAEWRRLNAIARGFPQLAHRMVPGNHDINFNAPFVADYDLARRADRESAFHAHAGSLADFPIVDPIIGDAPATVILLDSCRYRSTHLLSNAIGMFGDLQLARLENALAHLRGPILVIGHHHVWRDAAFSQPDAWFNTAIDADRLVAILQTYRRRGRDHHVMICHGHRHALASGWIGDADAPLAVVGLPSTTLGDKSATGQLDGMMRYAVAGLRADGTWGIALREVGSLVAATQARSHAQPAIPPNRSLRAYAILDRAPR